MVTKTVGSGGSGADYITDGVNDEVQINQAIKDVSSVSSATNIGIVHLKQGCIRY